MTFGEKLVYFRTKKQMTQKALAESLNITPTRLNYWEKDKREPDVEMIKLLADALDVSANVLIGYEEMEETKKAPAPEGAKAKEHILLDETNDLLVELGYIRKGQDLSDADLAFLTHIIGLIEAWFGGDKA